MTRSRRSSLVTAAAALGLIGAALIATTPATANTEAPEQWRSYWVDAFNEGIYTPAQVEELVGDAQEVNANALIVQVARRYDCFCNRALYPRTDAAIAPAPYDPLDEVIEQAHAAGLEVHAWVNVGTLWNSTTPHSSPDHVFNAHGPSATGADRWLNKRHDGTELVGANAFIDPANPAAVDYIVDAVQSITREYDVDGINLDYIRYPDYNSTTTHSDWGYSETSIARFQAATGRTDVPEPSDQQFTDWRREQITNLVRKIYLGMLEVDPTDRLTNDGITYGFGPQSVGGWERTRTYAEVLQDWKGWLEEGIIDTVVAMNYKREWMPDQAQMYAEWNEVLADWQGDRQAVSGPALYLNEIDDSVQQVRDLLTPTAAGNTVAGWSGYSYANPSLTAASGSAAVKDAERAALAAALTTGPDAPFAEDAAVPSMPWKENPTTGNVTGALALRNGAALDGVPVTLEPVGGGESQSHTTDGSGWFGFVDVRPGVYLLRVDLPDGVVGQPVSVVRVRAGQIATARTAPYVQVPR
ncbi:family 10 glycosylhydrolase [Jiangella gansuensis]|uniref:family 10 glycosylhydrolase n=1 Tax=Jiangella gansuensis TaxID=281473 RepID=UPI00047A3CB1|nr:family 10 glycosylhydrolase [Jiangella gansuensis]